MSTAGYKTKAKLSAATRAAWRDPIKRARMVAGLRGIKNHLGHRHTPEARRKIRMALLGNKNAVGNSNHLGSRASAETKAKLSTSHKGLKHSAATRRKMSEARKGWKISEETRRKLSASHIGHKHSQEARRKMSANLKARWADPEWHKRWARKLNAAAGAARPNRPERRLLALLEAIEPGAWRYVGDGSLVLGGKNPDFANINGQKKLIELFGDYWHRGEDPAARAACFAPFGYETLVIWERELKQLDILREKLAPFLESL